MPTRRTFLKNTVLAASLEGGAQSALAKAVAPSSGVQYVMVDNTGPLASAFNTVARATGIQVVSYSGDVATPWFATVRPLLTQKVKSFAGITSQGALFCLERWAWEFDMRVVHRLDHVDDGEGTYRHVSGHVLPAIVTEGLGNAEELFGMRAAELAYMGRPIWRPSANLPPARVAESTGQAWVSWTIATKTITSGTV